MDEEGLDKALEYKPPTSGEVQKLLLLDAGTEVNRTKKNKRTIRYFFFCFLGSVDKRVLSLMEGETTSDVMIDEDGRPVWIYGMAKAFAMMDTCGGVGNIIANIKNGKKKGTELAEAVEGEEKQKTTRKKEWINDDKKKCSWPEAAKQFNYHIGITKEWSDNTQKMEKIAKWEVFCGIAKPEGRSAAQKREDSYSSSRRQAKKARLSLTQMPTLTNVLNLLSDDEEDDYDDSGNGMPVSVQL